MAESQSRGSHDNMPSDKHSSKKREHSRERNKDRKKRKHAHKHKKKDEHLTIVDDDPKEGDIWTEKDINLDGEHVVGTEIPTAESLKLRASAEDGPSLEDLPQSESTESKLKRDDWMLELLKGGDRGLSRLAQNEDALTEDYGEPSTSARTMSGGVDFFSSLGTEHKRRKPHSDRPDPDKARCSAFCTTTLTNQILFQNLAHNKLKGT